MRHVHYCSPIGWWYGGAASATGLNRKPAPSNNDTGFLESGDGETRTPDPLHAKQVLYQLSYIPTAALGTDGAADRR